MRSAASSALCHPVCRQLSADTRWTTRSPGSSSAARASRCRLTRRLRSPAVHHVLVGNDRRAQVHRARARRNVAAASQRACAAYRHRRDRSLVLLHDLRLDDVELAGQRPGRRGDTRLVRRLSVLQRRPHPVANGRGREGQRVWYQRQVHFGAGERPAFARGRILAAGLRACLSTGSPLAPESFDYVYDAIGERSAACIDLGRHRYPELLRAGQSCVARAPWRIAVPRSGHGREIWNDEGQPVVGEHGELVCTSRFPPRRLVSGTMRTAPLQGRLFRALRGIWAHGDFAELTSSGGLSFTAAPMRSSIPAAFASARPRSTAGGKARRIVESIAIGRTGRTMCVLSCSLSCATALCSTTTCSSASAASFGRTRRRVTCRRKIVACRRFPDQERQDCRTRGALGGARRCREEHRGAGQSRGAGTFRGHRRTADGLGGLR